MHLPQPPRLARIWYDNGWLPLALLAAVLIGAPLTATFLWLEGQQRSAESARHGTTIARQLASAAEEPLRADDRIALSLLVRRSGEDAGIATSAIYGADDRLIVAADQSRTSPRERRGGSHVYQAPIRLDGNLAGYSRIELDPRGTPLALPLLIVLVGSGLLLGYIAWVLHGTLHRRLSDVRSHYEQALARQASSQHNLGALLELTAPEPATAPAPAASDMEPGPAQATVTEYGLVINVFNQLSLPVAERRRAVDDCLAALEPVCRRYGASAERLRQTGILVRLDRVPVDHPAAHDEALAAIHAALEVQQALQDYNRQRHEQGEPELVLRLGLEALQPDPTSGDISASVARGITLSALARDMGIAITDQVLYACRSTEQLDYVTLKSAALRALGGSSQAWLIKGIAASTRSST